MNRVLTYFSIIVLFVLYSCSTLKNAERVGKGANSNVKVVPHVIDTLKDSQIFELQMNFKENEFTGLLIMKKYNTEHYRFVLTSHFGMTIFDMELNKKHYTIHYCIPPLNNKRTLYLLRNDFSMLVNPSFFPNIRCKLDDSLKLVAFERKGSITQTVMYFENYVGNWPQKLKIEHPFLKLYITLTSLPNATTLPI